jgi:hypothetical protein
MELHELEVGDARAGVNASAMPSPVATAGFVVSRNTWPAPPVASSVARRAPRGSRRGIEVAHAARAPSSTRSRRPARDRSSRPTAAAHLFP